MIDGLTDQVKEVKGFKRFKISIDNRRVANFLQMAYGLSAYITKCAVFINSYLPEAISVMLNNATHRNGCFFMTNLSELSPQTTNFMMFIKTAIKIPTHL